MDEAIKADETRDAYLNSLGKPYFAIQMRLSIKILAQFVMIYSRA